ncbi:tRNA (adenine(58)-N(1))-methyltransferase, mitochondrial [Spea bombifrons]|uniref:tRNA (adenine(58)-N(1))-methyltransferase, mitochondrial n=1 Tax=Spea bombifrons TaxID=233779 RepID=UPI00234AECB7|nr:tRNA (adenine(58)-N(1))-methyltransferase, mitochondrial [Spea bombifrons]
MIGRRSLSPLDRVSQLVSPEFVSQEVMDLRNGPHEWNCPQDPRPLAPPSSQREDCDVQPPAGEEGVPPDPQGEPFKPGDLIIAEFKRRHYTEFKNMVLLTESGKLLSNWGAVPHADIVGKLPGQRFRTSAGVEFLIRRPSLEEYILLMKRGPTISYPKDIAAMLLMMDVGSGDVVLEAGSGSGGMSLFLSRAVGPEGRVYSFEVRADHHKVAKKNFLRWRTAWERRGRRPWPDNVRFINKDIADASPELESVTFDAVALDMLNPQVALPTLLPHLKQGAVCAVYLANITQVIDLLEGIRSCRLPMVCEKISEVSLKDWLVAPSVRKDGSPSQRVDPECSVEPQQSERAEDDESDGDDGAKPLQTEPHPAERVKPFGQVPYIARPMPWLPGHTAFLVQLRKFKPAGKRSQAEDPS